jgi:hypothetical protein
LNEIVNTGWLRYGVYTGGEVVEKARELGLEMQFLRGKSEEEV